MNTSTNNNPTNNFMVLYFDFDSGWETAGECINELGQDSPISEADAFSTAEKLREEWEIVEIIRADNGECVFTTNEAC